VPPCPTPSHLSARLPTPPGNETSLYEFFLEAANLKIIKDELLQTNTLIQSMTTKIDTFEAKMPEYEEAAAKAQSEYDGAVALRKLGADRVDLERLLAWSSYNDGERRLSDEEAREAAARETLESATKEAREATEEQNKLETQVKAVTAERDDLFRQLQDVAKQGQHLKAANIKEKKDLRQAERALEAVADETSTARENLLDAQKRLDVQLSSLEANQKSQQAKLERERVALDEKQAALVSELQATAARAQSCKAEHESVMKDVEAVTRELEEADANCKEISGTLKQIDQSGFQAVSRLHLKMPQLLGLLERERAKFKHPPIGPLGSFVKVTPGNEEYAQGAELALGGSQGLSTFVVQDKEDESRLTQLAKSVGIGYYVRVVRRRPDQRFNVTERHPATARLNPHLARFKTVLDVISVSDDTVFNVLVDNYHIESKLLFPTEADAVEALFRTKLNFGNSTRDSVSQISATALESGASFSKKARGLEERSPSFVQPQGVLQSDIAHAKRDLQAELEKQKQEYGATRAALLEFKAKV